MLKRTIGQSAAILDSDFIALVLVKDRQIVWANATMHRLFGYAPDELIGQSTRELFPDQESHEAFGKEACSVIAEKGIYTGTIPQKRKDGTTGWYELNLSRLEGDPEQIVGVIVDRTASYRSFQQLEANESRYRSVVEDQTEVISRVLPDGTFVFVNDVYCRLFGKTPEALIGQRWYPAAHPDDLPMIEARLREMSPSNPVVTIENRVFIAGGKTCWMQFVNRGFYADDGTLKDIQSIGRDITRLKQTETSLRESEERLELALAGSGLALWDWNLTTGEITFGDRWYEMLGYPVDTVPKHVDEWKTILEPQDLQQVEAAITTHLAGESPTLETEHRLRHREGHWITVQARGKITKRSEGGTPLRMVGTVLDVTQRKRLNEEGVELLKRIESLIRESTSSSPGREKAGEILDSLTKRERQILGMIAEGMTSAQIGQHLHLATNTVISHRRNLMSKLNLHSTAEVTRFAIDHGLMKQP